MKLIPKYVEDFLNFKENFIKNNHNINDFKSSLNKKHMLALNWILNNPKKYDKYLSISQYSNLNINEILNFIENSYVDYKNYYNKYENSDFIIYFCKDINDNIQILNIIRK